MFRWSCGLFPSRGIKGAMQELSQTPSGMRQQLRRRCSFYHFATFWTINFSSWSINQDVFRESWSHRSDWLACSARWFNGVSLLLASLSIKISMCEYGPILWPSLYLCGKQMSQTILISELSYHFVFKNLQTLTDEAAETTCEPTLVGSIAQKWEHWSCKPSNLAES